MSKRSELVVVRHTAHFFNTLGLFKGIFFLTREELPGRDQGDAMLQRFRVNRGSVAEGLEGFSHAQLETLVLDLEIQLRRLGISKGWRGALLEEVRDLTFEALVQETIRENPDASSIVIGDGSIEIN